MTIVKKKAITFLLHYNSFNANMFHAGVAAGNKFNLDATCYLVVL